MATVSLDPEAIEQLSGEHKALLDTIDSLRKHGIGRFVDLPQIIVVGDQSSGKSSVLEAISRVRFPVHDGVCTRFATELVLRTDARTRVQVQIQPASALNDVDCTFDETGFDKDDLPRIIEQAKARLLRDSASFSEDVLRVEICSPDVPHLTLVDLPGFYHSGSDDQPADGLKIVDRLVETYMARKNSIILAIVSARNQFVMQKVLSKVQGHDTKHERTLGIVTKPDLLISGSQDEDKFVRLARNQERSYQLALGWHVLRNRSEKETALSPEERDSKEEEFFQSSVWSAIPSQNRGVGTLRKKLANILLDHIRKNLDSLIKNIQDNMAVRTKALEHLGAPRSSPSQLRAHLDKIASQFQALSLHAIEGTYFDEFFGGLYPEKITGSTDDSRVRKLRALVRDLNRTFAYVLATKGSRRIIVPENAQWGNYNQGTGSQEITLPSFLRVFEAQYPFDTPEKVSRNAIKAELEPISAANQGTEFPGTTNDLLSVKLFQDQSRPWEAIARYHIDYVLLFAKSFTERLMTYITGPDQKTCSAILLNVVDPFFEQRKSKLDLKLQELLYHFQRGYPQPSDAEFRVVLARRHQKHTATDILQDLIASRPDLFTEHGKRQLAEPVFSIPKSEFGVDSLIDKSETYYELSLRTFTDNVIILAIENCLIKDLPTILTTNSVSEMDDNTLERLAAESTEMQAERAELKAECEALQKGLDLLLPEISLRPGSASSTRGRASERSTNKIEEALALLSVDNSQHTSGDTATAGSNMPSSGIIGDAITRSRGLPPGGPGSAQGDGTSNSTAPKPSAISNPPSAATDQKSATETGVSSAQAGFNFATPFSGTSTNTTSNPTPSPVFGLPSTINANTPPTVKLFGDLTSSNAKSGFAAYATQPSGSGFGSVPAASAPGPSVFGSGSGAFGSKPNAFGSWSSNFGSGSSTFGSGPSAFQTTSGSSAFGSAVNSPASSNELEQKKAKKDEPASPASGNGTQKGNTVSTSEKST
ncbi:hypothetical protein NUW58_g1425 [Xylaria curta]|uniref:Uncharacterized protein n=1 Tax=Xylaria curta TaxID=42375 RepID=A0ACC1PLM6_9PEZI|nr:hypothetical protein NUW58_g1425 [Xylaria curta]